MEPIQISAFFQPFIFGLWRFAAGGLCVIGFSLSAARRFGIDIVYIIIAVDGFVPVTVAVQVATVIIVIFCHNFPLFLVLHPYRKRDAFSKRYRSYFMIKDKICQLKVCVARRDSVW